LKILSRFFCGLEHYPAGGMLTLVKLQSEANLPQGNREATKLKLTNFESVFSVA